jgi:hypothetical protein
MKSRLLLLAAFCLALTGQAQTVVYENLGGSATAGYSEPNSNNPIFGDALGLNQGGHLSFVGLSLFNSTSGGNTGSILTGNMTLNIYNNTVPYAGGSLSASDPLIASVLLTWDFTAGGGLPAGFFSTATFDLTSLNITVPQNIFVTQQFTETSGTSTRNGVVLFSNPTTGSSPANVYINSTATAEGLYTFSNNPNQFGYHIEVQVVPEPTSLALAGLGGFALLIFRRRK